MKKPLVLAGVVCCLAGITFFLWPVARLEVAKIAAIQKFDADRTSWLSHVPSTVTNVASTKSSMPLAEVELSGCILALSTLEFRQDPVHKTVFTNDSFGVGFFSAVDPTNFTTLEQELNRSNVFDLISSAYRASVAGIRSQPSLTELHRYLGLIALKEKIGLAGLDHSFLQFDRGDFRGFIGGTFVTDKRVVFEIYIKEKDQFLSGVVKERSSGGDMNDVFHILSVLSVKLAAPTNTVPSGN